MTTKQVCAIAMQLLLNCGPTFAIFLSEHSKGDCKIRDCLTNALARLHAAYTGRLSGGREQNTYLAQGAFCDLCDKLFWVMRAAAKHKIGISL